MRVTLLGGLLILAAASVSGWTVAREPSQEAILPPPKPAPSVSRLANVEEVRRRLGLAPAYDKIPGLENLKVAVLDYGFEGAGAARGYLPENAVLVEHYDPEFIRRFHLGDPGFQKSFAPNNVHGRIMAQIIWAATGFQPRGPKFYLLNANGPTLLRRAVRYAIEAKVDVILFSGTFEGGGNGDGRGPINRVVAEALAADIVWINAAGNFGRHVYNGSVDVLPTGYLRFGERADSSALRFRNLLDENTLTITLTWNDYREEEDAGTLKDLDLYVEDWQGRIVGSSEKKQVAKPLTGAPNESRNPRERVVLTNLVADRDHAYQIRIKANSGNFTAQDRIRVLITSSREEFVDLKTGAPMQAVLFLDASGKGEIYPPADHPMVLTVGDLDPHSSVGPTLDHRRKPDVVLEDSRSPFTNGDITAGASDAAAYFAGIVLHLKAAEPGLRTRHLLWFAHHDPDTRVALRGIGSATAAVPSRLDRLRASKLNRPELAPAPAPRLPPLRARINDGELSFGRAPETASDARSGAPRNVWRTPSREHLAEVVRRDNR